MTLEITKNKNIAKFSYYGIGGPADEIWKVSDTQSMGEAWNESFLEKIPRIILGSGSNCVFSDLGFRGRVFIFTGKEYLWKKNLITVEAGEKLQTLIENTAKEGWSDLENLSGIPGTVGGAVRGNAGAYGSETSDNLVEVEYIDENGTIHKIPRKNCNFEYRSSFFKKNSNLFITKATFLLEKKENSNDILRRVKKLFVIRMAKYPPGRSGGSFFKNPENNFAGKLLEASGAKGDQIGGAQISEKHANFLLNKKNASQADILSLARKWQKEVFNKFSIKLEPEVVLLNQHGGIIEL